MGPRSFLLVALVAGPACDELASADAESTARIELDDTAALDASSDDAAAPAAALEADADGPGCDAYCHAYFDRCGGGAFRDLGACIDACSAWDAGTPSTRADSLACRRGLLDDPASAISCIAAGPSSPVCTDAPQAGCTDEDEPRCA